MNNNIFVGPFGGSSILEETNKSGSSQDTVLEWRWKLLKRSLKPDDVLFEEGNIYCHLASKYIPKHWKHAEDYKKVAKFPCCVGSCSQVLDSVAKYESHYNSIHRHVCHTCHRILPSSHLLEIHVLESHDSMFALMADKQDMYACLVEDCKSKFKDTRSRRNHMIKKHKYPANYRYDRSIQKKLKTKHSKNQTAESLKVNQMEIETDCKENVAPCGEKLRAEHSGGGEIGTRESKLQEAGKNKIGSTEEAVGESGAGQREIESGTLANGEYGDVSMDTQHTVQTPAPRRVFNYKVPKNISFGQGVPRGFIGGRGRGRGRKPNKKHWHNTMPTDMDTSVNIEQVDMSHLADALDTT